MRRHAYKAKRKSDSRQQNIIGSTIALRELKTEVTLLYRQNEVEEGGKTAGKITIGAQHFNNAITTIATVLADLFQNRTF